jgi:hypothetical protein
MYSTNNFKIEIFADFSVVNLTFPVSKIMRLSNLLLETGFHFLKGSKIIVIIIIDRDDVECGQASVSAIFRSP